MSCSSMNFDTFLTGLGLQGYCTDLANHGFSSCQLITNITEEDMAGLNFKLGHRRRLQRAIACFDGRPSWEPLSDRRTSCRVQTPVPLSTQNSKIAPLSKSKRSSRRHSLRDPNAPKSPRSAYLLFASFLRQNPEVSRFPFIQISKLVSEQWHRLDTTERTVWTSLAKEHRHSFNIELEEYKQTWEWQRHQISIASFDKKCYIRSKKSQVLAPQDSPTRCKRHTVQPTVESKTAKKHEQRDGINCERRNHKHESNSKVCHFLP